MSYKISVICLKSSLLGFFMLLLQSAFAQSNWAELDQELQSNQKVLGNSVAVLV